MLPETPVLAFLLHANLRTNRTCPPLPRIELVAPSYGFNQFAPDGRALRSLQLSLRTRLLLPLVFVIAGLTGATLVLVRHSVETQAQAQIEQEASNAILTVQAALNQRELILSKKADLLATVAYSV